MELPVQACRPIEFSQRHFLSTIGEEDFPRILDPTWNQYEMKMKIRNMKIRNIISIDFKISTRKSENLA